MSDPPRGGSVASDAADLRERVRRGELSEERVRLASQLGSKAAADALGGSARGRIKIPGRGPFEPSFEGGVEGRCRCYVAMLWYAFTHSESGNPRLQTSVQRSIRDFEAQVFELKDPSQIGVRLEKKTLETHEPKPKDEDDDDLEFADPLLAVLWMLVAVQGSLSGRASWTREEEWKRTWDAFFFGVSHKLNEVLRSEVLPWALGQGDPFRDRYVERLRKSQ